MNVHASIAIKNKNNVWIDDSMATHCHQCKKEFWTFVRKHHCRNCGNIFCYECSNYRTTIPDFITDRPNPADYWNMSYYISSLKAPTEKVCSQCFNDINEKKAAYQKIVEIFNNPISLDSVKKLPESEVNVKKHYFNHLRNIQYYLPNHKYTEIDKKFLKINSHYFSRHSKYLVHLIKSIDWNSHNELNSVCHIINGEKNKECSELYCTRTCQEQLSFDDCVSILYSEQNLPDELLQYIFQILNSSPDQIILCHLSFFVSIIKKNSGNNYLRMLVYELLSRSTKITYHSFWFLMNAKESNDAVTCRNIDFFIEMFDDQLTEKMRKEYYFFKDLINHLNNPKKFLMEEFHKYQPITLPYEPSLKIVDVDLKSIITKTSYTKPVIITFSVENDDREISEIKLLFKKESVMNDVTVLNLMTLCDIILGEYIGSDFCVVVYPIMPLSKNAGMIELVDKAETVHDIMDKNSTILQHILERNENKIIKDILDRYMFSLVSYTLHSYFLGLGDRHLENIMITDGGEIFHIDFGFILGTDAYPLSSTEIKLNSGMLDVIGSSDGERYKRYLSLCSMGIVVLRKYFNIFFILLSQDTQFKEKHVEKFVMSRFQPRQVDDTLVNELMTIINQSNNAYTEYVRDFLHYHTQNNTIKKSVTRAFQNAFHVFKN